MAQKSFFGTWLFRGIAAVIFMFLFSKCGDKDSENTRSQSKAANAAVAKKIIQSEPQVLDAVITDARVLYVGVRNDGTRRDGYASYLCQTMSDYPGASWERVKVVQVNTSNHPERDNAYGVLLGEAWCK